LVKFAIETTVTHLIEFSQTEKGSRLRIGRLPKGPTLYFNIEEFTLTKDLRNFGTSERDLKFSSIDTIVPAVVILNQFNQDKDHIKLVGTTLQNMFPAVNLKKFDYKNAKRVVLFDYNPETDLIDMRQFKIKTDSNDVKVNINLVETGPRMTLKLVKIVDEAFSGETIYHSFSNFFFFNFFQVSKTPQEIEASKKKRHQFESEKEARRKIQKENVEKKERAKEEKKMKETEKVSKIRKEGHEKMKKYLNSNVEEEEDDDEEYYRQEVGENPPEELELKKRKISNPDESKRKKFKK
jgi:ribosome biogenesis protein SSF1/2